MLLCKNLQKRFSNTTSPVLKNLHLTLQRGDFCILLGSNGSGKSTLLKTLSGEHRLDTGTITLQGRDITALSLAQRAPFIRCVSQDVQKSLVLDMTLLENVVLGTLPTHKATYTLYRRHKAFLREKIQALDLGLEDALDRPVMELSGGQKQSVALCMAMLATPQLLLLDEHTSALDPFHHQHLLQKTVQYIQQKNITTLMITHDLRDAIRYGNRLIVLEDGCIRFDVQGQDKKNLTFERLLDFFHRGLPLCSSFS